MTAICSYSRKNSQHSATAGTDGGQDPFCPQLEQPYMHLNRGHWDTTTSLPEIHLKLS
jgi:hypothetical protein